MPLSRLPKHEHAGFSICFVVRGAYRESCGGAARDFKDGDVIVKGAGAMHEDYFGEDMVAQLWVNGAEFWVHPAGEAIGNPSPQTGGAAVRLMLGVDDPDALFDRAVAAGAVVRSPMQDRGYGWRDGSVVDPLGHRRETGKRFSAPNKREADLRTAFRIRLANAQRATV